MRFEPMIQSSAVARVTHPPFVVDYDEYQGDTFQNDLEDPLTSAMMLLARAITLSHPDNGRNSGMQHNDQS
ncbi:hypothetical protein Tco_0355176 [Tanacetum coccineum]